AFPDVPGALVEVAVDRPELPRTIEPRDRAAVRPYDLALGIASGAPLCVEHLWRELNRIEGGFLDGGEHFGPTKVDIRTCLAVRIRAADGLLQHRWGQSHGLRQGGDRLSLLDPALRQLSSIVVAPVITLDHWGPPRTWLLLVERTRGEQRVIED